MTSSTLPLTHDIASYIHELSYESVPARVIEPLKQSVVDSVGCALQGSQSGFGQLVRDYVGSWESKGEATIWGTRQKAAAPFAAMVNSAACHAWDYDDTIMPAVLHPGSVAVPTAIAVAERSGGATSGRKLLTAIAAGYEVGNVIGTALGSKAFASSGFYNSVPTIFVAATTAAKLMGLDHEQIVRTIGLAASQAAGLYSATLGKRFNAPKAVMGGIIAADLSLRGLETSSDSIEASYSGFLNTFSRAPNPQAIVTDLGQYKFEILHKFYPCIRSNQPTLENVLLLLRENPDVGPAQITRIVSYVDQLTVDYTVKTTAGGATGVSTIGNALISLPYCVAVAAIDGELTLRQFTEARINDPAVQALMQKIELRADPAIDALPATQRYRCRTEVHFGGGRVIERSLVGPKGDPNNRLTPEEMRHKFLTNAAGVIEATRAGAAFELLGQIDTLTDVRQIGPLVSPDR